MKRNRNKCEETGKKKPWKKWEETGRYRKKQKETGRNRLKNGKKW